MTQSALEAALAAFVGAGGDVSQIQNASTIGQDRIVRKETSLGVVREIPPPFNHISDQVAPWLPVATDDVIFDYLTVQTDGLAPARAEDAESELAQKDSTMAGQGRASVIDWALKDHYDASDVNRARSLQTIAEAMRNGSLPLLVTSGIQDWNQLVASDRLLRRRKLDNRREKMVIDALATGQIAYNDGKIAFTVDFARPAAQTASNAAFNLASAGIVNGVADWTTTTFDPIGFFENLNQWFFDTYFVHLKTVIAPKKVLNRMWAADKFSQRSGLGAAYTSAGTAVKPDLLYTTTDWSPQAARTIVEQTTGLKLQEYDSVYRTRPVGSNTVTANRFLPAGRMILLPDESELAEVAATQIGFGKTLTSPHPEGNWTAGFYEWERSTVDPWGQDVGNGVKMFPVFPHLEYSVTVQVNVP